MFYLCVVSCAKKESTIAPNFDWIIGSWKRVGDNDVKTYEYWTKINPETYKGLGCALKGKDTVFKELLSLKKIDQDWFYVVTGVNESDTSFKLKTIGTDFFESTNDANDFPKKNAY